MCPIDLQPSTRRVVKECISRIVDIGRLFETPFHAGREFSLVSNTRHAKGTKSFSDKRFSLHYMNRESWRRYHGTVGLLVAFEPKQLTSEETGVCDVGSVLVNKRSVRMAATKASDRPRAL